MSDAATFPRVSVIIPVYNDQERLSLCLKSLLQQTYKGDFEIVVVDNNSDEGMDEIQASFPTVKVIVEGRPGSYSARNAGVAQATGSVLAFTDSDCDPDLDWLARAVPHLAGDESIGLVGGDIRIRLSSPNADVGEFFCLIKDLHQEYYVSTHHFAATANMITTRAVFESVGLFDGNLRSGGDREWGRRVFAAGYRVVFAQDAFVHHPARGRDEMFRKLERTMAGMRMVSPRRLWGFRQFFDALFPPFSYMKDLWTPRASALSPWKKLRVFMFGWRARLFQAAMTIKYHLTSIDAPRR